MKLLDPLLKSLCQKEVIYTHRGGGRWLRVEDSILNKIDDEYLKNLLTRVLLEAHQDIACLPDHVLKITDLYGNATKEITPSLVRDSLKNTPACYRSLGRGEKMRLLEFSLTAEDENFAELAGLELLPLASGVFTSFSTSAKAVYISSEDHPRELLPKLEDQFLDETIPKDILESLRVVAKKGRVSRLDEAMFF